MKLLLWVLGFFGFGVAAVGCYHGLHADYVVNTAGRPHAPSTFLLMGIFVLMVAIWITLLALADQHKDD